jgi:hypothetical protein
MMCDEWLNSFDIFYKWAKNSDYADNLSLDRIDNNKGYSPDNCRWATSVEQGSNKRANIYLTYKGRGQIISAWSRELGVCAKTIRYRIAKGMSEDKIFHKGSLVGISI